jgi:predicted  nucleic acid-binding Zn-ribbon protein
MPPLSLAVREITSVSVTFALAAASSDGDPSLASLGIIEEAVEAEHVEDAQETQDTKKSGRRSLVSGALASGLSVEVDGQPWRRVLIRVDDKNDEAVIVIYGLMPGRQYDIILALVRAGQKNSLHRQVLTEGKLDSLFFFFVLLAMLTWFDIEKTSSTSAQDDTDSTAPYDPSNNASDHQSSSSSSSNVPDTPPVDAASTFTPLTLEDRLNQLQHSLSLITAERESLTTNLKSARKESQKADAALRSEIDVLKRASERHISSENRSKQKVLALQEAAKRAQISATEMEEELAEVNEMLPGLERERDAAEAEYKSVKQEADRVQKDRDLEAEKGKKRVEAMRTEITSLTNKVDRLNAKREKLETGTILDLERQLKEIGEEMERVELGPYPEYTGFAMENMDFDPSASYASEPLANLHLNSQSNSQPQIGLSNPNLNTYWTHAREHTSPQSSLSSSQHPSTHITPSQAPPKGASGLHRHKSANSYIPSSTSTLSSLAPAFEPGRPFKQAPPLRASNSQSSSTSIPPPKWPPL